jgi:hypothetical protein
MIFLPLYNNDSIETLTVYSQQDVKHRKTIKRLGMRKGAGLNVSEFRLFTTRDEILSAGSQELATLLPTITLQRASSIMQYTELQQHALKFIKLI